MAPERDPVSVAWQSRLGRALLVLSGVAALLLGSNLFQVSSWIAGDIAYHRGVAYTMQGATWQGEGPYAGLISYYGGLYPLVLARLDTLLGLPFDTVLSYVSWAFALLWPLCLWYLARRIWPNDTLAAGVFVVLGTTAAPFTHRVLTWVDGVLASAQNAFPVYPRDVAMVLLVVMVAALLSSSPRTRLLGGGLALAGIVVVHLQMAFLAGYLLVVLTAVAVYRTRTIAHVRDAAVIAGIGAVASAWWWVPRAVAVLQARGLLLGGFPGAPELRIGANNFLMAFGIVGVLAMLAIAVLIARGQLPGRIAPFIAWIATFLPLILLDRAVGGFDLLSERRVWLVLSIPLTVLAAAVGVVAIRRFRPLWAAAFVVLVLLIPSAPGTIATTREIATAWTAGRAGGRLFDTTKWDPLFADLNQRVRDRGRYVVVTYDSYETWVWSFSGAQVPSLWLPGPFKLGFDPGRLTGKDQVTRVREQTAAFVAGRGAICDYATRVGADAVLLDGEAPDLAGLRDLSPGAPYRVAPQDRNDRSIVRHVTDGIDYRDLGGLDVLTLAPGATWLPGWDVPAARQLAIELTVPLPPPGTPGGRPGATPPPVPVLNVVEHGETHALPMLVPGFHRVVVPLDGGMSPDLRVDALSTFDLVRITTFEPAPDLALKPGPNVVTVAAVCGT